MFRNLTLVLLSSLFIMSCGTQDPEAGSVPVLSPQGHFAFYSDPWVSLHHFLYHAARTNAREMKLRGRVSLQKDDLDFMTPEILAAMAPALAAYEPYLEMNLLFTPELRATGRAIATDGHMAIADTNLRDALIAFMPVYKEIFWPHHQDANEKLIKQLVTRLNIYEAAMADKVAGFLESEWPATPIRVDISPYTNWAGAYTDNDPNLILLSSYDKEINGGHGFEILFHESSHTIPLGNRLIPAATAALSTAGIENRRFWHFALFYATGRAAKEVLNDPSYIPYTVATGLSSRPNSKSYYEALAVAWDEANSLQERLDGAAQIITATETEEFRQ